MLKSKTMPVTSLRLSAVIISSIFLGIITASVVANLYTL